MRKHPNLTLALVLGTLALSVLVPADAAAQTHSQLVGRWNNHVNGEPPWPLYITLRQNGTFERYSKAFGQKIRESGTWKLNGKKVVLTKTRENGRPVSVRTTFTYHSVGILEYDNNPLETYCKRDHPHKDGSGKRTDSPPPPPAKPPTSTNLRKIQTEGYSFYDKKTKLSYSIMHNEYTGEYVVESEKKFKASAWAHAKKLLTGQGVSAKKIYWVQACGL